ncbi:MAG: nematocidal protein AidA, partial [Acidobacteriota bacterium]|nr:nematocidal protein AidA [Acidobacteriota bacterium]
PVPGGKNVLPPQFKDMDFWFYQSAVLRKGTQNFTVWFALYKGKELYGYFSWDVSITIK